MLRGMFGMRVYKCAGVFDGVISCGLSEMSILSKKEQKGESKEEKKAKVEAKGG